MSEFVTRIQRQIADRLDELRPMVTEYERLQRALEREPSAARVTRPHDERRTNRGHEHPAQPQHA